MNEYFYAIVALAILVGSLCKYFGINPAIPLILSGLALEFVVPDLAQTLPDPETILTFILAPLVFAAGLASSAIDLRKVRRSVLILAVGLVVITTGIVGLVASLVAASLTLAASFALGAILAPTDAVAASSVARKGGLPRRVTLIIEGESLANDGTALTILRVAVVAVVAGSVTVVQSAGILLAAVLGGLFVGAVGGYLVSLAMRYVREPVVANAFLIITPLLLYQASEHIGGSGLLTVVVAGVWISHATALKASHRTRLQIGTIWSLITFLLESFAFVLVGAEFLDTYNRIDSLSWSKLLLTAVLITLLIMIIRALFMVGWLYVGPKVMPHLFTDVRQRMKEFIAIGLLGVRGPVSVLAAFSLPVLTDSGAPFPGRDLILLLTFGVVLLSLLASLGASPIIRRLNFADATDEETAARARRNMANAALSRLDEIVTQADSDGQPVDPDVVHEIRAVLTRRVEQFDSDDENDSEADLKTRQRLRISIVHAERRELNRMLKDENLPGDISRKLRRELDVREDALGRIDRSE